MTTIAIYYSKTAKCYKNYLKIQIRVAKKLFCTFIIHKVTYGILPHVCKTQLTVSSMQYLGNGLFYYCTLKLWWPSTKKMHAVSEGRGRVNSIILLKLLTIFFTQASNVSTWQNIIIFTAVWEKRNAIASAPTIFIHRKTHSKLLKAVYPPTTITKRCCFFFFFSSNYNK